MSKSRIGKICSEETKENLISESQSGENNNCFCGYYITPYGKFTSRIVHKWCKETNNNIISKLSKYLKSLKESPLSKTYKEIGFYFESK